MSDNTNRNNTLQIFRSAPAAYDADTDPTALNYGELGWNNGVSKLFIGRQTDSSSPATITPYLLNPAAALDLAGLVELATVAETNTGTDAGRAVTPAGLTGWTGDTGIVTVGEIATGTWSGTALVAGKVPSLDAITSPAGNVAMTTGSTAYRITGLAAPVSPNDAARKADVDAAVQGLDVHDSVRLISTVDVSSPSSGQSSAFTIDSVTAVHGDRVLLQNQTPATENGIYEVSLASSVWSMSRAADANHADDLSANMFFFVEEGTVYKDTGWVCTTNETLSTTNMLFAQFSGTGSYTATDGLDLTGTAFGIADEGVTLARMANMATTSILGRKTASAGVPEVLSAADARTVMSVDAAGTDNSTDVTLATVTANYLSISDQAITAGEVPVTLGGTGLATITSNGVMYGAGTSDVAATAEGATGTVLVGTTSGAPSWSSSPDGLTIDCGTFIATS